MTQSGMEHSRLVFSGPPGSGKTRRILDLFHQARRERYEDHALLIVPDSSAREHFREILARYAPPDVPSSFSDKGIQTLRSLPRMFGAQASVDWTHCRALIRQWVGDGRLDVSRLGLLNTSRGAASLADAIRILREHGYTAEKLDKFREVILAESPILLGTMHLWEKWLNEKAGRIDDLLALERATEEARKWEWDLVLIDGFTEILPPQWNLISAIIENTESAAVALDPHQPPSEKLLEQFLALGFKEEPSAPERSCRWPGPCTLKWLSEIECWKIEAPPPDAPLPSEGRDGLLFIEAVDPKVEAAAIARQVAREVSEGRSYGEIAILAPHLGQFRPTLESEFRRAGIPLRMYVDRPLVETGPGALMDTCLAIASGDWTDETVCRLLAHPGTGVPDSETEKAWKHVSEDARLGSRDKWLDWTRNNAEQCHALLAEINSLIEAPMVKPGEFADELINLLGRRLRRTWRDLDDSTLAGEGWAWDRVSEAVLEISRALSEIRSECAPDEVARFVREELQTVRARPLDRRRDCVSAVTLLGARTWSVPVAIVAGLSRDYFPKRPPPRAFLPDSLCEKLDPPLPTTRERREREQALFRVAVTRASEKLVLSRPIADSDGSPLLPSAPLAKCREWLENGAEHQTIRVMQNPPLRIEEATFPADIAALAFHERIDNKDLFEKLAAKCRHQLSHAIREGWYDNASLENESRLVAAARGSEDDPVSAKYLNDLAQCRYRFFASRLLKFRDPRRERVATGLDYVMWGNIAHDALAAWHRSGRKGDFETLVREAAGRHLQGIPPSSVIDGRIRQIIDALTRFKAFEDEFITPLGFRPEHVEMSFGRKSRSAPSEPGAVEYSINGNHRLVLGGRVDRIDLAGDKTALIIDYKRSTSQVQGDIKRLADGADFQLATYIALVERGLGFEVQLAFFVPLTEVGTKAIGKIVADRSIAPKASDLGYKFFDQDGSPAEHLKKAGDAIAELIDGIGSGDITPKPRDPDLCGSKCLYHDLCRYRFTGDEGVSDEGGTE
jgi:hypothetical protein